MALAFVFGLVMAIAYFQPKSAPHSNDINKKNITLSSSAPSLKKVAAIDYTKDEVPDFTKFTDVTEKKEAFFNYLKPVANAQNDYIKNVRKYVISLQKTHLEGKRFSAEQQREFIWLIDEYRVDSEQDKDAIFAELLRKIDIIPVELVLVQTANESGWGTSRFAVKGYNFFGLWCFRKGCGFVPSQRDDDAEHEVAKFDDLSKAMYSYMRNLNRHPAYKEMRVIREKYRANDKPITAYSLANGLRSYSERGEEYIEELHDMIRVNQELISP